MSSPSPRTRPARIASRISGVTYLPKVSFTISRSRRPCSMRLKPSATAPISSVLTTGAWPSRWPRSTSAIAASTCRERYRHAVGDEHGQADRGDDPGPDQEEDGQPQVVHDDRGGDRVGAHQGHRARVGQHAEDRERNQADQQEDREEPDAHREPGHALDRAQLARGEELGQAPPPLMLAREEDEGDGRAARDHGVAEDLAQRLIRTEHAGQDGPENAPDEAGHGPAEEAEPGEEVRKHERPTAHQIRLGGRQRGQLRDAVEWPGPGAAEPDPGPDDQGEDDDRDDDVHPADRRQDRAGVVHHPEVDEGDDRPQEVADGGDPPQRELWRTGLAHAVIVPGGSSSAWLGEGGLLLTAPRGPG